MTPEEIQATAAELSDEHWKIAEREEAMPLSTTRRRELARRLLEEGGWSKSQIARHLGITRQRVGQILTSQPVPAAETKEATQ